MSKGMSENLESLAKASQINSRILVTIITDANTFYLVANDNESLIYNGNTYSPAEIKIGDMQTSSAGDKEGLTLELSNKWLGWASYVRDNAKNLKGKKCIIKEVFKDNLADGAVWLFEGKLNKIKMTVSTFSASVERDTIDFSQPALTFDYGPTCQYVYKDTRCRATSALTACGHVLPDCIARNNVARFGGKPSIANETIIRS